VHITGIRLSDIKGFAGARMVDLPLRPGGGWTVIAGRNGSGKTTLLRALALVLSGPRVARSLMPDFSGWVTAGAHSGSVEVRVAPDYDWDVHLWDRPTSPEELALNMKLAVPPNVAKSRRPAWVQRPDLTYFGPTHGPGGPWEENPTGWFCAGYGPFRRLVGGSGEAQRLMLAQGPAGRLASLFHEDASLAEGVSWLIDLHLRHLEKRRGAAELLSTVKALLSDGLLPDGYRVVDVNSEGMWIALGDDTEHAFPLREMSDGYRTVVALVLDIVRQLHGAYGDLETATVDGQPEVHRPGVVLIDEIDAHLHVTWQRGIGDWLRQHFPDIQFIVTSHSPYICQSADPGGLIRLPSPDEERAPEVVDEDLYQRIVYGSGDDAALSELFGLETPYSSKAEAKRKRLVELERKVFAGEASPEEAAEYQHLGELLTSSLETRVAEVAARLGGDR
jgi:hypothetical protein